MRQTNWLLNIRRPRSFFRFLILEKEKKIVEMSYRKQGFP
jgi:hypothetical protein